MGAIAEITQEQVDPDDKKLEDFAANIARANKVLLTSIEQKDVMALYGYEPVGAMEVLCGYDRPAPTCANCGENLR